MSREGIIIAASLIHQMQQARITLLGGDNIDIRLGQLFLKANDAIKDDFCRITGECPEDAKAAGLEVARRTRPQG
jgi:UDP-N-acetylglucosamine enolpyruvyl transferase